MRVKSTPKELEDDGKTTIMDELREINLGTKDDLQQIFVGAFLPNKNVENLKKLLCEFRDCFA